MKNIQQKIAACAFAGSIFSALMFPLAASAATGGYCSGVSGTLTLSTSNLTDIIKFVTCFIENSLVPLAFAVAIFLFIFGVVKFIGSSSQEEARTDGKKFMIWGIVAFAVMFSVWGLVNILTQTFHVSGGIPQLPITK